MRIEDAALFERAESPAERRIGGIGKSPEWFSWSRPFRDFLGECGPLLTDLPQPELIRVPQLTTYDYTFSLSPEAIFDHKTVKRLQQFSQALFEFKSPTKIMLFTDLFFDGFDGRALHRLFALLRHYLAALCKDPRQALYAPLGSVGTHEGEFPLHADLYVPELLFNVFDEVPNDDSGASTFLPVSTLLDLMETPSIPDYVQRRVRAVFEESINEDSYDDIYDFLYDGSHPWVMSLLLAMTTRRFQIKLRSGEGYLIHDRTWLHGRTAPKGGVTANRVHRLIFNSRDLWQKRSGPGVSMTSRES